MANGTGPRVIFSIQLSEFDTMKRAKKAQNPGPTDSPDTSAAVATEPAVVAPEPVAASRNATSYTVVARRYRPQRLEDLVGQDHVVFPGSCETGDPDEPDRPGLLVLRWYAGSRQDFDGPDLRKMSQLREKGRLRNCRACQICDICESIALGQDVDVIEIDGASNNGVEQVRELRQNAGLRPSRARYKIYYIDEVHMLTTGAFNAS